MTTVAASADRRLFRILIAVCLVVGIALRLYNLNGKIYWVDEVLSSVRMAGYTEREIILSADEAKTTSAGALLLFQKDLNKPISSIVISAADEDPHVPPLYYILLRLWANVFGTQTLALRCFSVLTSLLALPLAYLLCVELFESHVIGLVAVALMAVSPMHVLFAQEERPYSLIICAILLSANILLKTVKRGSLWGWSVYTVVNALALYTQPIFVLVMAAHAIFMLLRDRYLRGDAERQLPRHLISILVTLLLFMPWAAIMLNGSKIIARKTEWLSHRVDIFNWLKAGTLNLSRILVDFDSSYGPTFYICAVCVSVLIASAIWSFCKTGPKLAVIFLLSLVLVPALPLLAIDLAGGGIRALIPRYFFATYIGVILIVAYFLGQGIERPSLIFQWRWQLGTCLLLILAAVSSYDVVQAPIWWNKSASKYTAKTASIVDGFANPLVIASYSLNEIDVAPLLSLCKLVRPQTAIEVVVEPKMPTLVSSYSDYLLYMPTDDTRLALSKQFDCHEILEDSGRSLWLLKPRSANSDGGDREH